MLSRNQFQRTMSTVGTVAAVAAVGLPAVTHEAPKGGFVGDRTRTALTHQAKPVNQPSWSKHLSRQFEGYSDIATKPESHIPSSVVAVHQDGKPRVMGFDKAWSRGQDDNPANDVWTVGYR